MIVHWILIFLIVVVWGRFIITLLRLFSFKLALPVRSLKQSRSITKMVAALATITILAYLVIYGSRISHEIELMFVLILPFVLEEWVLPLFTKGRVFLDGKRIYDTRGAIVRHDLADVFAVKILQDQVHVFTHSSSLAFLTFHRLDYSVNDWEVVQDYFHKYHGTVTKHY